MNRNKELILKLYFKIMNWSINSACKEQNLCEIRKSLSDIVPNIGGQYTTVSFKNDYWINNIRTLHAFQIRIAKRAISLLDSAERPIVVDIGDSSGTHIKYLLDIFGSDNITALSVNLDLSAVEKIRKKNLMAIHSRAELLHKHPEFNKKANIFLSYEMLEHLFDPISFLNNMSSLNIWCLRYIHSCINFT